MEEHIEFVRCDEWLRNNGTLRRFINAEERTVRIEFQSNNQEQKVEMTGEDVLRLTIQLYNEVWE